MRNLLLFFVLILSEISLAHGSSNPCRVAGPEVRRSENLLSVLTQVPTPAFVVLDLRGSARFVPPARIYSEVLQTNEHSLIINDLEDLRFISQTLARSEILLVLKGKVEFPEAKAQKILSLAKILNVKISMVWLNDTPVPKSVKNLVAGSGGKTFETRDLLERSGDLCSESLAGG